MFFKCLNFWKIQHSLSHVLSPDMPGLAYWLLRSQRKLCREGMDTNELISSLSHRRDVVCLYSNQHVAFLYKSAVCGFFSCAASAVYWLILIVFPQSITMCLLSIATELRLSPFSSRTFPCLNDTRARTDILDIQKKSAEEDSTGAKRQPAEMVFFSYMDFLILMQPRGLI